MLYTHRVLRDLGFTVRPTGATPFHLLRSKTVAELDQLDLTLWDRKSYFDPACGLSRREFFHLITSPATFVPDDARRRKGGGLMAGRVILIEGLDLAGKSTLVRNLQTELTRRGIPVRVSRNALCPDNPIAPVADALRRNPGAGLLETGGMFLASHLWDARNFEPPPEGEIHVQDSCWMRTLAHHTFHETPRIPELLRAAAASFPRFDVAIFLTADLVERRRRLEQRECEHPGSNDANDHLVINDPDCYLGLEKVLQRLAAGLATARTVQTTGVPEAALVHRVWELLFRPRVDIREHMAVEANS